MWFGAASEVSIYDNVNSFTSPFARTDICSHSSDMRLSPYLLSSLRDSKGEFLVVLRYSLASVSMVASKSNFWLSNGYVQQIPDYRVIASLYKEWS